MANPHFHQLDARAALETGDPYTVERYTEKVIQFIGPFVANIDVEGSLDPTGTNWGVIDTVSAPGLVQVPGTYRQIRLKTTSFTSGTPLAYLGGRDDRSR